MASPEPAALGVTPNAIAEAEFDRARKGFDRVQVRAFLTVVAREFERLTAAERELTERASAAEARLVTAERVDPEQLTHLLGDEAARVLAAARESAAARLAEAETKAAAILHDADVTAMARRDQAAADAQRVRADADDYAREARRRADAEATQRLTAAEAEAADIRARAESLARDELAAAQTQGDQLVADAERVRERVLKDFSRRRKQLRVQVEQLRAARDRLLDAHRSVRASLDAAERELDVALPEARAAAEAAGFDAAAAPEPTLAQLAAEVEMARSIALPVVVDGDDNVGSESYATGELEISAVAEALAPKADGEIVIEPDVEPEPEPEPLVATDGDIVIDLRDGVLTDEAVESLFERIRTAQAADDPRPAVAPTRTERPTEPPPIASEPIEAAAVRTQLMVAAEPGAGAPALLAQRDAVLDVYEVEITRLVKRALADEQNEMQDLIRRAKPRAAVSFEGLLPSASEHTERFAGAIRPQLAAVARAAAEFFALPHGEGGHDELVSRVLRDSLVEPLRSQCARAFAETAADEERIDRVRSIYREAKSPRADLVARELTAAVFNAAVVDAAPPMTELRWVIDPDRGCSPDCYDNSLAASVLAGSPFPTGALCPPAHHRCRCMVAPAAK